ncbi:MAG: hypothetical protein Q7S82_02345, partial [bacterium]|nr:hypothetical protein [bacterium]
MSITIQYVWLVGSLGFFGIWLAVFFLTEKESRKEMLIVSLMTSLFGLLAQFFIRQYWDPPTLFSIIHKAGFSIENIIFAFSVGGVAIAIYKAIFKYPSEAKGGDKDAVLVAYPSEAKGGDKDAVLVAYPSEAKGGD